MGFPRQENWSGLPFPSPGDFPDPGIKSTSPAVAGRFFTTEPPWKPKADIRNKLFLQSSGIQGPPLGLLIHWKDQQKSWKSMHVVSYSTDAGKISCGQTYMRWPWTRRVPHVKLPFVLSQWSQGSTGVFGDDVSSLEPWCPEILLVLSHIDMFDCL